MKHALLFKWNSTQRLLLSVVLSVAVLWGSAAASPENPVGDVPRTALSLEGEWQLLDAEGHAIGSLEVPFAFLGQTRLVIERSFRIHALTGTGQYFLVCDAVAGEARLWLNGHFLGSRLTGFLGFEVPVDPAFLEFEGENRLRIEIDGHLRPKDSLPLRHRPEAPREVTGIPAGIRLVQLPPVAIRQVSIVRQKFEEGRLRLEVDVELLRRSLNENGVGELLLEVRDPVTDRVVGSLASVPVNFAGALRTSVSLSVVCEGVRPWSPDAPSLYELEVKYRAGEASTLDVWRARTGFREVRLEKGELMVNGRPFRLKAVEWVPPLPGWGSFQSASALLSEMKSAGCNAVRVVGYPVSKAFLHAADSVGLFVLEEIPVWKVPGSLYSNPRLAELVADALRQLVDRDQIHPCVLAWGLGTDVDLWTARTGGIVRTVRQQIADVDARPIYAEVPLKGLWKMRGTGSAVDLLLVDLTDLAASQVDLGDFGAAVIPIIGYSQPRMAEKTEERVEEGRAFRLWQQGKKWRESPAVPGLLVRAWTDWQCSAAHLPLGEGGWMRYGLVGPDGEKRLSYFVLKALYAEDELPSLRPVRTSKVQLNAFALCGLVLTGWFLWNFRRDRRFRGNIRRVFNYPSSIYEDVRSKRKISAYHTFLQGLFASSGLGLIGASFLIYVRDSWLADEILELLLGAGPAKTAMVWLAWRPMVAFAVLTTAALLFFTLLSVIFWVVSFVRFPVPLGQSFIFVFWIATAFHPAVLWGIVAYRLIMSSSAFVWVTFAFCSLLVLWFALRFARGSGTILRISPYVAAPVFVFVLLLLKLPFLVWIERSRALLAYLGYYLGLIF